MSNYIRKILQNETYKIIITNILSLFSLQGFTYILPIITFPYLTRVLGPGNFGLLAFALAFIGYFQILTDYGFNSPQQEKYPYIMQTMLRFPKYSVQSWLLNFYFNSKLYNNDHYESSVLEKFRINWLLYYFTFGIVIGNLLLPPGSSKACKK